MIEVAFKVRKFEEVRRILEWIKREGIEKNHPNIKIKIEVK